MGNGLLNYALNILQAPGYIAGILMQAAVWIGSAPGVREAIVFLQTFFPHP